MQAVLTADIVNSTQLSIERFHLLEEEIRSLYGDSFSLLFYRGDSYQVFARNALLIYSQMLLSRLKAISYSENTRIDIRQSIRIGFVNNDVADIGSHVDPVFIDSGRIFDTFNDVQSDSFLLITCGSKYFDISYDLIARYTDNLLAQITPKQANVVYHLLTGKTQKETAAIINVKEPTISQQAKSGGLRELKILIEKYKELTQMVIAHGL